MERFFLDKDPRKSARLCSEDKVEEYLIACANILCTALYTSKSRINDYTKPPKKGNAKVVGWVIKSMNHWKWMWLYGHYLGNRYSEITKDIHQDTRVLRCLPVPSNIHKNGWKDPISKE